MGNPPNTIARCTATAALPRPAVGGTWFGSVGLISGLVDADAADIVEIREYPVPGTEPVDANVITGESNGVEWAMVWFEWFYDGPAPEVTGSRIWMGNGLC